MKIDIKKPRYMLPLVMLPFLCLFFYIYKTSFGKQELKKQGEATLQENLAEVSDEVKRRSLSDKLDAYRNQYRDGDGYTAVGVIGEENVAVKPMPDLYNQKEKLKLDSIDRALKQRYGPPENQGTRFAGTQNVRKQQQGRTVSDQDFAAAIEKLRRPPPVVSSKENQRPDDPMRVFREQMRLIDSMGKANDPSQKAEAEKNAARLKLEKQKSEEKILPVQKGPAGNAVFNTITSADDKTPIRAIIDQDVTGYAGSRLRIRLLDNIMAGNFLVKQGTYLYAQVSGFSGQRVLLNITSVFQGGEILPIRLEIYDNDGMAGLYVPASTFREFTKELGGNASQGISIQQQAENDTQLVMGMLQKMFQSTTTAVNKLIRSNKAKIKYATLVYLIDPAQLKDKQKKY